MNKQEISRMIEAGRTSLGIELGSTRIKAVLIGTDHRPIASGGHRWESRYESGVWTYSTQDIWDGLRDCYRKLAGDVLEKYGVPLIRVQAMGISAMMHGYMAFDAGENLLTPFRTWRNTTTGEAAAELTELFEFNIPQRWSVAHIRQAMRSREEHVSEIRFITTLAGYVHWNLTGQKVLGVGDGSGMFPIDSATGDFNTRMLDQFDSLTAERDLPWRLRDILPRVLSAGESAGILTLEGALLLDPSGQLQPGIPLSPPEGDAGTGMVATNSVAARTGNVSAGTSIFAMIVLERPLLRVYPEIDMVTTPSGEPVAMAHCNNCTTELDAWVGMFGGLVRDLGVDIADSALYDMLYEKALEGDADCGGLLMYNYHAGEPVAGLNEGRPLLVRSAESRFNLANFMRLQVYSILAALKLGMDILDGENVALDRLTGHGGLFKTPVVAQRFMAAATGVPITVLDTAGEGGAWGIALLASYVANRSSGESLENYLSLRVFSEQRESVIPPDPADAEGFKAFMDRYTKGLNIERAAIEHLNK